MNKFQIRKAAGWVFAVLLMGVLMTACKDKYKYESVKGDPMGVRIYTLSNGLKVYMSVNHDAPRLNAYVAVRAGSKNDPEETTGLAHYFEHLMFKGTKQFGTSDFAAEEPLLDQIEALFEQYRQTTDEQARTAIYHQIDSISYEASKLAIPNEYDKLMAAIGAQGTNAYTSLDVTCYTEDIPANQLDNWAKIQADRFQNTILRGFHTELETVYEEYNMGAGDDNNKAFNALLATLFPGHPYGRDVIGLPQHLKNPSITNIKHFHDTWYVPNNMAVVLSGDFDPDEAIAIIDKHFGTMQPNDSLPQLHYAELPAPAARDTTVYGLESEYIMLAWRMPGAKSAESTQVGMMGEVLINGSTGLLDVDLNQKQTVLGAYGGTWQPAEHGVCLIQLYPKQGQTLEELKQLALAEVKKLREGDFADELLEGIVNNYKKNLIQQAESYDACTELMLNSFVNGTQWADEVRQLETISQVTKDDITALAQKYLGEDQVVTVYKRQSDTADQPKIAKPHITPIESNRDAASQFLTEIQQSEVKPIEPRFLDYRKDLSQTQLREGIPVLYKHNETNGLFELTYVLDMGYYDDRALGLAATYLDYLGTADKTPEQIKADFYRMACCMHVHPSERRTYVSLHGLDEQMDEAIDLFEHLLTGAVVNTEAYENLVQDILKDRQDAKSNKSSIASRLSSYIRYGSHNPETSHQLSAQELLQLDPQQLVDRIHQLCTYKHRILYYGPRTQDKLLATLSEHHHTPEALKKPVVGTDFAERPVEEPTVFLVDYDDNQSDLRIYGFTGQTFDPVREARARMFSDYFDGGMNGIVFQELRERRSLAYHAWAWFSTPGRPEYRDFLLCGIATQNDKLTDALAAFHQILTDMPQSEKAFNIAKESALTKLRTNRTTKANILWSYISAQDRGIDYDLNQRLYEEIQTLTLQDVQDFQRQNIQPLQYHHGIVGRKSDLDLAALARYGKLQWLTLEDIFGY